MNREGTVVSKQWNVRRGPVKTDHLGKTYRTQSELCAAYKIKSTTLRSRLDRGYTLEQALTGKGVVSNRIPSTDHTGKQFPSKSAMCRAWNVPLVNFETRISQGWSLEEALTGKRAGMKVYKDHLGKEYPTFYALCHAYGISEAQYHFREERGWTLKQILTYNNGKPTYQRRHVVCDHMGNTYGTLREMCDAYGINPKTFYMRKKEYGWSLEDALTTKTNGKYHRDLMWKRQACATV